MCLTPEEVNIDLVIIKNMADHIRIYNVATCPDITEMILEFAQREGLRVILGLYICADEESNEKEIGATEPIVEKYGNVIDAVLVGNEVLFAKILTLDELLFYIKAVKAVVSRTGYSIPVTTADVWPVYESAVGPTLVAETDFLCMNMQPYWEGWDIVCPTHVEYECSSAGEYVHLKAQGLEQHFQKPVWVCESGWPTEGERCCEGRAHARDGLMAGPSVTNASIFINELVKGGRAANRPTYVHTIFDEDWKRIWAPCGTCEGLSTKVEDPTCDTCELDYHFGIYDYNRDLKAGISLPDAMSVVV